MASPDEELRALRVTRGRLHALAAADLLDPARLAEAMDRAGFRAEARSWAAFVHRYALLLGVVLTACGVIFFVAANWSQLGGLVRIGLVSGAMLAAIVAGAWVGDTLTGRSLNLLGALLFGPSVAVYGQIYQTGADAWELFASWTLVMTAFAAVVRFTGTWVFALVLLHVAAIAWADQARGWTPYRDAGAVFMASLAAFDLLVVTMAELRFGPAHLRATRYSAGFGALALLLPFGVAAMVGEPIRGGWLGLTFLAASLALIWATYRWRRPDIGMLAAFATVSCILVTAWLGWVIFERLDLELFGISLLGLLIGGQVWALTRWLLAWRRRQPSRSNGGKDA